MLGRKIDKSFLIITLILLFGGFFIFTSASLGLLAREGVDFFTVAFNQIFFGLILGLIAMAWFSKTDFKKWNKYAFYIFLASLALTALVFVPGLGFSHGGARRWILLGSMSFQPAEFLKIGFVIYFSAWLAGIKEKVKSIKYGLLPLVAIVGLCGVLLLKQPDTGTLIVIFLTAIAMYIVAGGKWSHAAILSFVLVAGVISLMFFQPYIKERVLTFLNPTGDPQGASYQIQQSLIAIGSGGWGGRGFGQSIQKFKYLPEPIGDSIFAVFAEEWGFIGCSILIILFLIFVMRGLKIASEAPNSFSRLFVAGIIFLIIIQSFINISSMLGIIPLTGVPLIFVSKGGTALFSALAAIGIILNISKYRRAI